MVPGQPGGESVRGGKRKFCGRKCSAASVSWSPIAIDSVSAHEQKLVKKKHLLAFTLNVQLPAAEEKLADPVRAWWLALLTGQTGIEPDGPLISGDEVSTYFRKAYMDRGRDRNHAAGPRDAARHP